MVNMANKGLRDRWRTERRKMKAYLDEITQRCGVDLVDLRTDGPVIKPLTGLFDQRRQRQ
jgi:hypothetical protein